MRFEPRWKRTAAIGVAMAVLVPAACGSDDASTSSGAADEPTDVGPAASGEWEPPSGAAVTLDSLDCAGNEPSDDSRGVTDTEITVGALGTVSGPTTSLWGDAGEGARARFERANAEGGVHGRTIDFTGMVDDGLESSRSVDAARQLTDEAFAVAPVATQVGSYADVFCDEVVPYFGWGTNTGFCGAAFGFGITGCIVPQQDTPFIASGLSASVTPLVGEGATVAIIGGEDEPSRRGLAYMEEAATNGGLDVVYAEGVAPYGTPIVDPSPIVNDVMTSADGAAPDVVFSVTDFANTSTLTQALAAAGYDGVQLNGVGYDPRLAEFEGFDDTYVLLTFAPFEATDLAFVEQMNADLDEHAPDAPRSLPTLAGYIAADFLLEALDAAGPDLTVSGFVDTLNGGDFTYSREGFLGQTHWPLNHVVGTPCNTIVHLEGGDYTSAVPLACGDPIAREE
jgi:ABC-type branched-subunit amino acid transport system substrate-binding protein